MHFTTQWPWLALLLLGAYHGINPGMGWLFAVSLGLQERSARAVLRALAPLGLGHLISIGLVVAAVEVATIHVPHTPLRIVAAAILFAFGLERLLRARHPRWATKIGMQVGFRDLTLWSFLMASAHGAGLMLIPVIVDWPHAQPMLHMHAMTVAASASLGTAWLAPVAVHTAAYLGITGLVAIVIYAKVGVAILRRAWLNLDLIWAAALVFTGMLTLLI